MTAIPKSISGLTLWLDASDSSSITLSGGNMTKMTDKSGTGNTMTPFAGNSNVTVSTAYQNGLNVLNFSGGGVYRSPSSSGVYPSDVYVVVAVKDLTTAVDVIGIGSTSTDNFNSLTFSEYTSKRWHNGSTGFNRTPNCVSPNDETSTSFLLMQWSIANGNYLLRRNGVQIVQTSSYTFTLSSDSVFQLGLRYPNYTSGTLSNPFRGYIGELLVFTSQLSTTNQQIIEGYLAWKWGLQTSLQASHPYRNVYAPFTIDMVPRAIPSNTSLLFCNTISSIKTFTLPAISANPGRVVIFKDITGGASTNKINISTTGTDGFENSFSSIVLATNYGAWSFMNDYKSNWFLMNSYKNTVQGYSTVSYSQSGSAVVVLGTFGMGPWGSSSSFVDATAKWIWTTAGSESSVAAGIWINFNKQLTVSVSTPVVIHVIVDDDGTAYLNNISLGSIIGGGWGTTAYTKISATLSPGTNLIKFYAANGGSSPNPAGIIAAIIRVSDSAVLAHTDSTWVYY